MYSNLVYKLFYYIFKFSGIFGSCSVQFNLKTKTFYSCKLCETRVLKTTLLGAIMSSFWSYRVVEIWLYNGGNSNPHFHITYAFTYIWILLTGLLIFLKWINDDFVRLLNHLVRYLIRFQRK